MKDLSHPFLQFLNSDRYQYTEADVILAEQQHAKPSVFDYFFRKTEDEGYAVVAGVSHVLHLIELLNTTTSAEKKEIFSEVIDEPELLEYLSHLTFKGNVYAMPEGEIVYSYEPVIVIEADFLTAKLLETPLLNTMNYQMTIASKANRVKRAAQNITVAAFGPRRAHGWSSAVHGTRAALVGGADTHSSLMTEYAYDISSIGTMSHSYIQAFGIGYAAELNAFTAFIRQRKINNNALILLIDTYDTAQIGIINAITAFQQCGIDNSYTGIFGIRIDSGDLAYLSKFCRQKLDQAGLTKAMICLTNSLDEYLISSLLQEGTAVDLVGIGDTLAVNRDNPCFGGVYKLVSIDNQPVIKVSGDIQKVLNPHRKEVYRILQDGMAVADLMTLSHDDVDRDNLLQGKELILMSEHNRLRQMTLPSGSYVARPLLLPMMINGKLTSHGHNVANLELAKQRLKQSMSELNVEHKRLVHPHYYKVDLSTDLYNLKHTLLKRAILQKKLS